MFMNVYLHKSKNLKIKEDDWYTPNTYGNNYKSVPQKCGVYFLVVFDNYLSNDILKIKAKILYVGSSQNLAKRKLSHEVIRYLRYNRDYDFVAFYFKEVENYKEYEIELIKEIKPPLNKHHNGNI